MKQPLNFFALCVATMAVLTMAGCFRPSGDVLPTTPTVVSAEAQITPSTTPPPPITSDDEPTPTLFSLLVPTVTSSSTRPVQPTLTVAVEAGVVGGTPEQIFITPGGRQDFITPDPVTPTAVITAFTNITPNSSGDSSSGDDDAPDVSGASEGASADECVYIVEGGDSLYGIALFADVTLSDLRAANPDLVGENPILQIDDAINLPIEGCNGYIPPALTDISTDEPDSEPDDEEPSDASSNDDLLEDDGTYIVRSGDTLVAIAQRFGVTVSDIVRANAMSNPNNLSVGQRLIIPAESATPVTPLPTTTPRVTATRTT